MTRVNSGCNMTKIQHFLSYFSTFPSTNEWKKSSKWFLSTTRFLFLGDKPWLGLNNMIFIRVEKFYVSSLRSTGIAVLREVIYSMKLLLYWTHWKNLDLKSHLDLQVITMTCWLRKIKQKEWRGKIIRYEPWLCWTWWGFNGPHTRFDEADSERKRETNEKNSKIENELPKAQEMRQTSLQTFCQTKKRKESNT